MTETDATKQPLQIPDRFIPYLEKYRIYKLFKDMVQDLVINLPQDHLKHMKVFLNHRILSGKDADRVIILVSPEVNIDINMIAKDLIKDLGFYVITRRCVMDRYEKSDNYVPGCISPVRMAEVTKSLTMTNQVAQSGWLMFDHPCTLREARCLQQLGVLPTMTLVLTPPPPHAPRTDHPHTARRSFFDQDFEALKFAYKATLKEIYVNPDEDTKCIEMKCVRGIRAAAAGAHAGARSLATVGAPGNYRVLLLGPRGCGRRLHAKALSDRFGLVHLHFNDLYNEAKEGDDEIGEKLRSFGLSTRLRADIVRRRLAKKDCIDNGWVLTGFPTSGADFENLDNMPTPPNRIIFLNADWQTCKTRVLSRGVDWCSGQAAPLGSGPRVLVHPDDNEAALDAELDTYFTETLAELRAAAGINAEEVDACKPIDQVQVEIQAAIMATPAFNMEFGSQLSNNVRGD
ncbi:adenylate kinase 8 [Papilio machaon]|uniref:adenylate kinase 8 n=1 Tax=Papilio machaon TaxID=76193 RepID=UPI001E663873|nr:adenylate kinase 8 [Papilio machaon]